MLRVEVKWKGGSVGGTVNPIYGSNYTAYTIKFSKKKRKTKRKKNPQDARQNDMKPRGYDTRKGI